MKPELYVFDTASDLSKTVADRFMEWSLSAAKKRDLITVALPGGSTPRLFFGELAEEPRKSEIPWRYIHLFWGDERCVPPDHPDSNFKMGHDIFLRTIPIPEENIHRIKGEANPEDEAQRYAEEIRSIVPLGSPGFPRFDWIFLGLGSDGHTASLFPGSSAFEEKESICVAAEHPLTGQNRITLTLPVINSAARVSFLVSGIEKSGIVARILGDQGKGPLLPASKVSPQDGLFEWYLDRQAASMIRE